ncbi:MAG: FadR/GntR family transcriptional regulator [Coprobacillaceae bacterium]
MQKNDRSLVNQTITKLNQYMEEQKMQPGDKLPIEKELASIFNVGRSTLREAVKILAYADILEVRQGAGTFLKQLQISHFSNEQLTEVRGMLEQQAIEVVCKNRTTDDLLLLKELLFKRNSLLEQGLFSQYIEIDLLFHKTIIQLSKNPFL